MKRVGLAAGLGMFGALVAMRAGPGGVQAQDPKGAAVFLSLP